MALNKTFDFSVGASPSSDVVLTRYDSFSSPGFKLIFETLQSDNPLRLLAQPPEEAARSAVLENRGERDITAFCYSWLTTVASGETSRRTCSSDSYATPRYHPVLKAKDRKLITPRITLDESLINHIRGGGGCIGGGIGSNRSLEGALSLRLEIDLLVFSDGEIAGPDRERYALELQYRKIAGDFIVKQVKLAQAEQRDVSPVLSALAEAPRTREDSLARWTRDYAQDYLRHAAMGRGEALVQGLENRPALPRFFRREGGSA
jgi:hypothetical protein